MSVHAGDRPIQSKPKLYFPRLALLSSTHRELIDTDACAKKKTQLGELERGISALENSHIFVDSRTVSMIDVNIKSETNLGNI